MLLSKNGSQVAFESIEYNWDNNYAEAVKKGYQFDGWAKSVPSNRKRVSKLATGGHVNGPGTGTSDSIPAYLSNGEYVVRAAAVNQYGKDFFDGLNAQKFGKGGSVSPINKALGILKKVGSMYKDYASPVAPIQAGYRLWDQLDKYNKNKDIGKIFTETDGYSTSRYRLEKSKNAPVVYVNDSTPNGLFPKKDRSLSINAGLKYLTEQTGVIFKLAKTKEQKNNDTTIKVNFYKFDKTGAGEEKSNVNVAGYAALGSNEINLRSPKALNLFTAGRKGSATIIAHEILHSIGAGETQDPKPNILGLGFDNHAMNPFNLMFPLTVGQTTKISKADSDYVRSKYGYTNKSYLADRQPSVLEAPRALTIAEISRKKYIQAYLDKVDKPGTFGNGEKYAQLRSILMDRQPTGDITKVRYANGGMIGPRYNIPNASSNIVNPMPMGYNNGGSIHHYNAGGIVVNAAPGQDVKELANHIVTIMDARGARRDSMTGGTIRR